MLHITATETCAKPSSDIYSKISHAPVMFHRFRFIVSLALRIFHQTKDIRNLSCVYRQGTKTNLCYDVLSKAVSADRAWCFIFFSTEMRGSKFSCFINLNNMRYSVDLSYAIGSFPSNRDTLMRQKKT